MKWYEDPTYIKQCEKAEEIQSLWKPRIGDWFYKKDGIGFGSWCVSGILGETIYACGEGMYRPPYKGIPVQFMAKENYIWLPSQDRLHDIYARYIADELEHMNFGRSELMQAFIDFSAWLGKQYQEKEFTCLPTNVFDTGEQLWLAFVMKEKHSKSWMTRETWEVQIIS